MVVAEVLAPEAVVPDAVAEDLSEQMTQWLLRRTQKIATYPVAGVEVPLATAVPLDAPPSLTDVLRQEVSLPDIMVTISEYAVAPVLSLRAMLLDSSQLRISKKPTESNPQDCVSLKINVPSIGCSRLCGE